MLLGQNYSKVIKLTSPYLQSIESLVCYHIGPNDGSFNQIDFSIIKIDDFNYKIIIDKAVINELGYHAVKIMSDQGEEFLDNFSVEPYPISLSPNPSICIVSGNIIDLNGLAKYDTEIKFRIVDVPKRVGNSMVTASSVKTTPDAYGNFSIQLLRGVTVVAEIPNVGIKNQFIVPDQDTANIIDLLPESI